MQLYPFVVGKAGHTQQRIERDNDVELAIPTRRQPDIGHIAINGPTKDNVLSARSAVDAVIASALASRALDYTHFVSLPLTTPATAAALRSFKQAALLHPGAAAAGLDASIFTPPPHLHLTVVMLKLYSEDARQRAQRALLSLQEAAAGILAQGGLHVRLQGLKIMRGSEAQADVVYADVVDAQPGSGAVQRIEQLSAAAMEAFSQAGLVLRADRRPVKLHATLINTRYRQYKRAPRTAAEGHAQGGGHEDPSAAGGEDPRKAGGRRGPPQRQPIDATQLMQRFGAHDFGEVHIPGLHLSQRGVYGQDGYYHTLCSLPLTPV